MTATWEELRPERPRYTAGDRVFVRVPAGSWQVGTVQAHVAPWWLVLVDGSIQHAVPDTDVVPATYQRVVYRPEGGRRRTVILERVAESALFITGREVDVEGCLVAPSAAALKAAGAGDGEILHVIDRALVERRMPLVMSNIYGRLVEPGEEE